MDDWRVTLKLDMATAKRLHDATFFLKQSKQEFCKAAVIAALDEVERKHMPPSPSPPASTKAAKEHKKR